MDRLYFDERGVVKSRADAKDDAGPSWQSSCDDGSCTCPLAKIVEYIEDEYYDPERPGDAEELERRSRGVGQKPKVMVDIGKQEASVFVDFLSRLIRYEPGERVSAEELLNHLWLSEEFLGAEPAHGALPMFQS